MSERCAALWIGSRLGAIERACLRSVLRQGHPLSLYCYQRPLGIPEGVEVRDAAAVLPPERMIRHHSGSPSLFSNHFRYEIQRRGLGVWVDTDTYLLEPLPDREYLFGMQEPGLLAIGVLRLPPDAPVLGPLLEIFEERVIPPWLRPNERLAALWRRHRRGRTGLALMPWGTAGPHAFTYLAKRHNINRWALAADVLYPLGWRDADRIRDPRHSVASLTTSRSVSIHLWNEAIKTFKDQPAPAGSFLARLQTEGA